MAIGLHAPLMCYNRRTSFLSHRGRHGSGTGQVSKTHVLKKNEGVGLGSETGKEIPAQGDKSRKSFECFLSLDKKL